jgi:hypothetical protein
VRARLEIRRQAAGEVSGLAMRWFDPLDFLAADEVLRCKTRALAKPVAMFLVAVFVEFIDMIDNCAGKRFQPIPQRERVSRRASRAWAAASASATFYASMVRRSSRSLTKAELCPAARQSSAKTAGTALI